MFKDNMVKERLREWIENSKCMIFIEMSLLPDVQGLGRLDIELIKETNRLGAKSKIQRRIRLKHLTLSKLWIFGAYELVRVIDEIITNKQDLVSQTTRTKVKDAKIELEKIRIPLTKFQMPKRQKPARPNRLFAQFPDSFIDSSGEVGWKVYTAIENRPTEIYYRRKFGDLLLKLFEEVNADIRAKYLNARN